MSKIYDNGIYRTMRAEELQAEILPPENNEITPEERLEVLEAAFMELAEVVFNG